MASGSVIEFRCQDCGQRLRAGESKAGKKAKCPKCGALTAVPGGAVSEPEVMDAEVETESPNAWQATSTSRSGATEGSGSNGDGDFVVECPHCDVSIEVASLRRGREQVCPQCGGEFAAPEDLGGNSWRADVGSPGGGFGNQSWAGAASGNGQGTPWGTNAPGAALEVTAGTWFSAIVTALGGPAAWKYFVDIDGVEHSVPFARPTLIPVTPGLHQVEIFVLSGFGPLKGRYYKQRFTVSVGEGNVQPVLYRLAMTIVGVMFNGVRSAKHSFFLSA